MALCGLTNLVWYYGYSNARALAVVFLQAGNDLSRESTMKAATHLSNTTKLDGAARHRG
jgi:hypothetical protein